MHTIQHIIMLLRGESLEQKKLEWTSTLDDYDFTHLPTGIIDLLLVTSPDVDAVTVSDCSRS